MVPDKSKPYLAVVLDRKGEVLDLQALRVSEQAIEIDG